MPNFKERAGTNKNARHSPGLSPRFSTFFHPLEQEWRVPGQAVLKSNDDGILRLYFLEAHQRLTKYLSRSSSTLQKGGDVVRFKRNRVHLCKKKEEKEEGREKISSFRDLLYQIANTDRPVTGLRLGFFNFCNCEGFEESRRKRGERFLSVPFFDFVTGRKENCPNLSTDESQTCYFFS